MSSLQESLKYLQDNGYVSEERGRWYFTEKFYRESSGTLLPVLATPQSMIKMPVDTDQWITLFVQLISQAEVPRMLSDNKGGVYYANKYSVPAMKVFRKAIEKEGVVYELLVKSVMLYYKSASKYKKTVGNYFVDGDWLTDYQALKDSVMQGADALTSHIEEQVNDPTHDSYEWG